MDALSEIEERNQEPLGDDSEHTGDPPRPQSDSQPQSEPERQRPVPEDIFGTLLRLKNKPSTFSSWDTRFLSVDPRTESLHFHLQEKDRFLMPLQVVPLAHINKVQAVDRCSLQLLVKGKPETVIFLRASSCEDKLRWVHHLELFLRELKVGREGGGRDEGGAVVLFGAL
jgi:hypothetical protein